MHITNPSESLNTGRSETTRWVQEMLEPEQLATVTITKRYGRRRLSQSTKILIWSLRVYVILMVFLIGDQVWQALHL